MNANHAKLHSLWVPAHLCSNVLHGPQGAWQRPSLDCELAPLWMLSGRFQEAEEEFVKAGKPREAIDMWCHQQDWAAALSVAERCDPQSVPDILAAQVGLADAAGPEQVPAWPVASLTVACASVMLQSCGCGLPLLEMLSDWRVAGAPLCACCDCRRSVTQGQSSSLSLLCS